MGQLPRLTRAATGLTSAAAVLLALMLTGCGRSPSTASSRAEGSVTGRAILVGRLPGGGRPFTVGAVRDGKVMATVKVRPGGHFRLVVPAGHYRIGLWIPGAQLSIHYMSYTGSTTVKTGDTSLLNLNGVWHD
jgi:hypothetical protein